MIENKINEPISSGYLISNSTLSHTDVNAHISNLLNQHSIVAVFDSNGVFSYANQKFCELYQTTLPELTGKTYLSIHAGNQSPSFFAQLWHEISSGKTWKGEIKIKLKDDTYRWMDVAITPLADDQGTPIEYVAIHTDTTRYRSAEQKISELLLEAQEMNEELRASEEELRQTLEHAVAVNEKISQSEARYRLISESMRDMICLHKVDGTYTYISQSVKALLGYAPEELLGTDPFGLFHPEDIDTIKKESHQKALNGHTDNYIQYRIRKKDGTYTWFETLTHPITDELGRVTSLHTASRDISIRKLAEDQRDNFFKHSLELMVIADKEGHILKVNSTWEQTFLYENEELKGKLLFDFIHPDDIAATHQAKDSERLSGNPTVAFENRYRCRNGSYHWLSWNSVTFSKDNLMYGFAHDITERKQKEEVLKNTLEELKKRNHELDNYVYKVSHDLRAPLTSIMGLINLVKMEQNTPAVDQYITLIENRIVKSDQFIQSIINHSKILNSKPEVNLIEFRNIISECFEDLKYMPNASKIRHEVNLSQQAPFYSDLFRVSIVFKNIISNAIKYLNPAAVHNFVDFHIQVDRQQANIQIEDNGIGIAPEHVSRMFDMFFRGTPVSDGSGLGLYIVKQTLEQIEGEINVASEPGKGTTFAITLTNSLNGRG